MSLWTLSISEPYYVKIPNILSHTLPDDGRKKNKSDDGRSISRNVAEKHYDSRHDKLKNSMNTTESTNTNVFNLSFIQNETKPVD